MEMAFGRTECFSSPHPGGTNDRPDTSGETTPGDARRDESFELSDDRVRNARTSGGCETKLNRETK